MGAGKHVPCSLFVVDLAPAVVDEVRGLARKGADSWNMGVSGVLSLRLELLRPDGYGELFVRPIVRAL